MIVVANNGSWGIEVRDPLETHGKVVGTRLQFADHAAMARAIPRALAVVRSGRPGLLDGRVASEAASCDARSGLASVPDRQALGACDEAERRWR